MLALSRFTLQIDFATGVRSRVVQSLDLAFLFVPVSTAAFANIAKERTNYAGALCNLARNIGGSWGIAAATMLLARRSQFHQHVLVLAPHALRSSAPGSPQPPPPSQKVRGGSAPVAGIQAHGLLCGSMLRESSMLAFSDAFWLMVVLFRAVTPLMFFMKRKPVSKGV